MSFPDAGRVAWRVHVTRGVLAPLILVLALGAVLPWLWLRFAEGLSAVPILIGAAAVLFALLSMRTLMPAALVLLFLAAEALGLFGDLGNESLPYLQLAAGVRITLRDALLIGTLPIAVLRLFSRREVPLFTRPFLIVVCMIGVGFALGALTDRDLKAPVNALRPLFGYTLYIILVAAVDSRPKLIWLLGCIFGIAILAVGIQVAEAARGSFLPFLGPPLAASQTLSGLSVDGRQVPYIWNRAVSHLFLALLLALGGLLVWRGVRLHFGLVVVCVLGFTIMLTRSWYVFIGAGVLAMLAASGDWTRRLRFVAALTLGLGLLGLFATAASELTAQYYGGSLVQVWLARSATLLNVAQDPSFVTRVAELRRQLDAVEAAPLLGYGLSAEAQRLNLKVGNLDTGVVNTLLMFGVLGTAAFAGLVLCAAWSSVRLARSLPVSWERGYALGLVGVWVGVLAGYAFNYDFLTHPHGPWLVVLGLAVGDRLERLRDPPVE